MQKEPVFRVIARKLAYLKQSESWTPECRAQRQEFIDAAKLDLRHIERNSLPSGSGIDCGTKIDRDASKSNRLVFTFEYHHMNDYGMYDGWTSHKAIVTPDLTAHDGFSLRITGRNRNQIKEYLHQCFDAALCETIDAYPTFKAESV